jgi:cation:H+ antiporter
MPSFLEFETNPTWLNVVLLVLAAVAVWLSGSRLSVYADAIAGRTGLGRAFVGLLLLATATSLPEIATTLTASAIGNAELVTSNLFGGVAMQTAILALVDIRVARGALSRKAAQATLLIQGIGLLLVLTTFLCAVVLREPASVAGVGLGAIAVFAVFVLAFRVSHRAERHEPWRPVDEDETPAAPAPEPGSERLEEGSAARLYLGFGGLAAVVLAAGWVVSKSADAVAQSTGIGSSVIGATLVAIATSLPEITTTLSAARIGAYPMAVANIFGGNLFDVALVLPADAILGGAPLLSNVARPTLFLAVMGMLMTCVYLWGMLIRARKTIFRIGIDSATVLGLYAVALAGLYLLNMQGP